MGEVVHTSRITIVREKGPTRRAMIEGFGEPVYYGVHGGITRFYGVELPAPYRGSTTSFIRPTGTKDAGA